ncbi:Meiosis-specific protein ASY3 [Bienertia sinuspersici]
MSFLSSQCNYQLGSQSQKMSIGIVVDSVARPRYGSKKEPDVSVKHAEKEAPNVEHMMGNSNVHKGEKASSNVTVCKNDVQEGFMRVATGSLGVNLLTKDTDHVENQSTRPAVSSLHRKQPTHTLQSFANEASSVPGVSKKTAAESASGKENKRAFKDDAFEKFSSVAKQQVCLPSKEVLQEQPNEMENRNKEALRMKLRALLGSVPSANKKVGDSRTPEVNADEVIKEQTVKVDSHSKPWQNSDTIETDSENVDVTIKRRVTRSLTRRKAPVRRMPRNLKSKSLASDKQEYQGDDIFSFAGKSPLQPRAVNRGCSKGEKNDRAKRSGGVNSEDLLSPIRDLGNTQPKVQNRNLKAPAVKESPLGGGGKSPKYGSTGMNEPEAATQNRNLNHSPIARENDQQLNAESPAPREKSVSLEPSAGQSPVPHVNDLNNLWSKLTKDVPNSPVGSCQLGKDKEQNVHGSAQSDGETLPKANFSSKSSTASENDSFEYSEDADKLEDTHSSASESSTEEREAGNSRYTPARGEFDSTQDVSSAKKEVEDVDASPENRAVKKPRFFQSKSDCSHGVDFGDFSPTLPTPKASGTANDVLAECLDECPDDGLARVVSLLGMALQKVKNKMMLVTNKRCSEILVSAAEEIQSQLQNVESQIQTDLGKLTSLKTSKRKHMETRLQEQQEHLKVMHEKFKQEICQYLQNCKGAMEGLEAQHIELQGAIEKQKALHRKLLLQTENAVETHLTDAQKQMMSIRKLGKQKMQHLKAVISECLKEGISR